MKPKYFQISFVFSVRGSFYSAPTDLWSSRTRLLCITLMFYISRPESTDSSWLNVVHKPGWNPRLNAADQFFTKTSFRLRVQTHLNVNFFRTTQSKSDLFLIFRFGPLRSWIRFRFFTVKLEFKRLHVSRWKSSEVLDSIGIWGIIPDVFVGSFRTVRTEIWYWPHDLSINACSLNTVSLGWSGRCV